MYEYRCERCGKVIEVLQKYSDAPLTIHEGCGGSLEKLISQSAFQLKGSGWYATDYPHRGSAQKSDKTESKSESQSEGKSEGKSDAKSEGKSESKSDAPASSESKSESKPAAPAKNDQ
jgi:putative FmdB family regulatory protein